MVYLVQPEKRCLYALGDVRVRYVNGDISIGGVVLSSDTPAGEGFVLQLWTKDDESLELNRFDIDVFSNNDQCFFNATSVRGMSSVLYSSKEDSAVMKTVSMTL
jgi:hypothetical protein